MARSAARRLIAAATASGAGAQTKPLTPSSTNSERPAGIEGGDDRLPRQKRLERDVAEVLVEGRVQHRQRVPIQIESDAARRPRPRTVDTVGDAEFLGKRLGPTPLAAVANDDQPCRRIHGTHAPHGEIRALDRLQAAHRQHVVADRLPESSRSAIGGG